MLLPRLLLLIIVTIVVVQGQLDAAVATRLDQLLDVFTNIAQQRRTRIISEAFKAVVDSDIEALENYLAAGNDIDAHIGHNGLTLLHYAADNDCIGSVEYLIKKGANLNVCCDDGMTPLMDALYKQHTNIVRILLANHASVKTYGQIKNMDMGLAIKYDFKLSALSIAIIAGNTTVIKELLDAGANPNGEDLQEYPPILMAVRRNGLAATKLLIASGARVNQASILEGLTNSLHMASELGQADIIHELLQAGADPSIPAINGDTALHAAARDDHGAIVRLLLDAGANSTCENNDGNQPIDIAPPNSAAYKILNARQSWFSFLRSSLCPRRIGNKRVNR